MGLRCHLLHGLSHAVQEKGFGFAFVFVAMRAGD